MNNNGSDLDNHNMDSMYSELYYKIKPYIDSIADKLKNTEVDEDMIDSIVTEILKRVGISNNTMDNNSCPMGMCPNDMDMLFDFDDFIEFNNFDDFDDNDVLPVIRYAGSNRPRRRRPRQTRRRRPPVFPMYPVYPFYPNSPEDFVRWLLWREIWGI